MKKTVVFRAGEHGVAVMRIPGRAVSKQGTLLAFCEARDGGDRSPTDLVLKRSEDGGGTWGPLQLVVKARAVDAIMNPSPVVDLSNGAIHCFSNIFPDGDWDVHHRPGAVRTIVSTSTDDGLTWSGPSDITEQITDVTEDACLVTGPGAGIQTSGGRLVIPFGLEFKGDLQATILYSDDHGKTWKAGGRTPAVGCETQVVEVSDGHLRLDMRNQNKEEKPAHCRYYSISRDGGQTWSRPERDPGLFDPPCQGSILRYPFAEAGRDSAPVLFANPAAGYNIRRNLEVRLSYDDGQTWPVARTVQPGPAAYCCLAALPDGDIGLLYEAGEAASAYECIAFARFSLQWLLEGSGSA